MNDTSTKTPGKKPQWQTRRQAVLVIHGMGEQIPLETMSGFVETVYQRDLSLGATQINDPEMGTVNQVWIIPDPVTGSAELRKISTEPRSVDRLRTDFFEFYWADIMQGTPIEAVFGWIRGLILRTPWAVPPSLRIWITFLALWGLTILFVLNAVMTLDPSGGMIQWFPDRLMGWVTANKIWIGSVIGGIGLALGVIGVIAAQNPARVKVGVPAVLIGFGVLLAVVPDVTLLNARVWSGAATLIWAALLTGIIAPYLGDVVRYVRATPETVERRQRVRERGLALLKALHDKKDEGTKEPYYERIIVVAHSLGTIVAYDLIQLYWQATGPSHMRVEPVAAAKEPLEAIDKMVIDWWGKKPKDRGEFDLKAFQRQQARMFEAIAGSGLAFRISDFITMGSPLAHAEFLMKDDAAALERDFEERALSASPPRPDKPNKTASYMLGKNGPFAHFAAPFSAVRWTNIYDEHWFPLMGDIVSGRLGPAFGPGIDQRPVKIERPGWPPILNRFVTHTYYWFWHKSYNDLKDEDLPAHIKELRAAMQLNGEIGTRSD